MEKKMVVGVTGGIACGKSTVVAEFKKLGARVIDADKIAHQALKPKNPLWKKIIRHFGKDILNPDLSLKTKQLARLIFQSPPDRLWLNCTTHPVIIKEIKKELNNIKQGKLVVLDAPLLFEAQAENLVNKVIVVKANRQVQVDRLKKRDGLTKQQALARIHSQMSLKEKIKRADYVIDGTQTRTEIRKRVKPIYNEIATSRKHSGLAMTK